MKAPTLPQAPVLHPLFATVGWSRNLPDHVALAVLIENLRLRYNPEIKTP